MGKDPAVLWYFSDWNSGTGLMSRFLKGCYMDLLHAQFNHGRLSLEEIKTCLGSDFGQTWPTLQKKFKADEKGLFFNERLELEKVKRQAYCKSRGNNRSGKSYEQSYEEHMSPHMENRNRNRIKSRDGIEDRKVLFINGLQIFANEYDQEMLTAFAKYWTEHGPKDKKMRFEKEKSFDVSLRLSRWADRQEKYATRNGGKQQTNQSVPKGFRSTEESRDALRTIFRQPHDSPQPDSGYNPEIPTDEYRQGGVG